MQWKIPGTTLTAEPSHPELALQQFGSMFLAGGMVLSQVTAVTGVESYTVQNWVKRGFLPSPRNKRYDINQVCRIIHIQMLKAVLPMEKIVGLLSYINGHLDDSSDDIIDDSRLYFMFLRVCAATRELHSRQDMEDKLSQVMTDYRSDIPGAEERVKKVLRIMLTAWIAARLIDGTEQLITEL